MVQIIIIQKKLRDIWDIFPRKSLRGNNQSIIQFQPDEDGSFDEIRFVKDNIIHSDNKINIYKLTKKILTGKHAKQMNEDAQKLYTIKNSDLKKLEPDEQTLMNLHEFSSWILKN